MSLVQAFHNIFVDKYCLMYTEETASFRKRCVFSKNGITEGRKSIVKWKYNTCLLSVSRRHQAVLKQKF